MRTVPSTAVLEFVDMFSLLEWNGVSSFWITSRGRSKAVALCSRGGYGLAPSDRGALVYIYLYMYIIIIYIYTVVLHCLSTGTKLDKWGFALIRIAEFRSETPALLQPKAATMGVISLGQGQGPKVQGPAMLRSFGGLDIGWEQLSSVGSPHSFCFRCLDDFRWF